MAAWQSAIGYRLSAGGWRLAAIRWRLVAAADLAWHAAGAYPFCREPLRQSPTTDAIVSKENPLTMRWFWIDRFTEFVCGSYAVAVKGVSLSEGHLHDHFVGYPIMPNSLITEGMAQAGGLLVSEQYGFGELVVLGKLAKAKFHSCVRPGETLTYRVKIDSVRDSGAAVTATAHVGDRLHAEATFFYARLGEDSEELLGARLFRPSELQHWLSLVRVFEVGVHADGTRMQEHEYPLSEGMVT